ncbi:hypothetical protein HELRODRAFT_181206 [Helobdella robusta]|uniref:Uncharacterized protein n=1 Tax=Helobdella robusta TaxID=6412 RepID=T1FGQ6_HELRO|nr:hypothetical protein HELRODRAFT_181206 [Helobdella robusta]ESN93261.1 hypothetical protein HELRODRAFT_181206 [Helobdella robusta]
MAESTRKKQDIYLLGQPLKTAILGNKLPAKGEVMRRFLYIHLLEKMTVRDSETAVIREVFPIWQRARISTTQEYNAIKKLDDMFKLWQGLKIHSKRNQMLKDIQEDRKFLLAQREPGRRGYMSGIDKNLALKEARSYERKRRQENYKLKSVQAQEEITAGACSAEIKHSSSDSLSERAGVEKLLSVPKLKSSTGERQATAVHECLLEWNLEESVKALVFDTTASNNGKKNGACTLLQQKLGRNVLHIACRHHISEIILEHAFSACMSSNTSGPEIALFLRFRNEFNSINQAGYHTIMNDESMNSNVEQHKEGIVSFCLTQLEQFQPRCDYRELLKLSLILLGETPPRGVRVLQPGALHRARWMARLIYVFKLYMYRHQFLLTRVEEKGICRFIVFGISVYLRSRFTAPDLLSAARHDLLLVKRIQQFRDVDCEVSVATANALSRHLWYVSEELVGAVFFDDQISHEEKVLMVDALSVESKTTNDFTKRLQMNINDISDEMSVKDFVSSNTM